MAGNGFRKSEKTVNEKKDATVIKNGAPTIGRTTLNIMPLSVMILSIVTLIIMLLIKNLNLNII
jgi:hypothetical protein